MLWDLAVFLCLLGDFCYHGPYLGSAKTDPDQFKRVLEEGLLKNKFDIFEAIFSYKSPIPERRKTAYSIAPHGTVARGRKENIVATPKPLPTAKTNSPCRDTK